MSNFTALDFLSYITQSFLVSYITERPEVTIVDEPITILHV